MMGLYLNPRDTSKELWLVAHATERLPEGTVPEWPAPVGETLVCLVDNGGFTAAAVAYSRGEWEAFTWTGDHRPKLWFRVPLAAVAEELGISEEDLTNG